MNSAAAGKNEFPVALSAAELRELRGKGRNVTEIAHEIETLESEALISSRSRRIVRVPLKIRVTGNPVSFSWCGIRP
jgi:hypothetical protein